WTRASDNVAVGGYRVVVDSRLRSQGAARTFAVTGLACDTVHTVSVRALDMVSNLSAKAPIRVRTGPCPPAPTGLSATTSTVGSLHCAVTRTFQVESVDASGSVSAPAAIDATTLAC